jgi:DNA-binding CsgD family transcriptional regulator
MQTLASQISAQRPARAVRARPAEPAPPGSLAVDGIAGLIEDVLEAMPEAIIVLDRSMRVVAWSRAASIVTGFPASAAMGGLAVFEGGTLVLDTEPGEVPARPARPARCFWEFRVKDFGGPLEDVVAVVIPLGDPDLGAYIHLVPRPSAEGHELAGRGPTGRGVEALTPREREILHLLAAGKTAKPIAAELCLSVPTVRTHIQHILRKLGVHSCLEAAVVLLRSGGTASTALSGTVIGLLDRA